MKNLAIIIVSWNVKNLLIKLIRSIFKYTKSVNFEIVVVDNNSKDNTVFALKNNFSKQIKSGRLKILAEKENHGFAKANNIGWKASKAKYVWFLNPDMEFIEDSTSKMLDFFQNRKNLGAIGCKLLYKDREVQPTVKAFPKLADQLLILLKLHHFIKTKSLKRYLAKDFDYNQIQEVDQIMGACVLTENSIMEKIGGWDEYYWLWWEDVDLCKRIKENGFKIVYYPKTSIIHYEGKSFEQVPSLNKQKRFNKGMRIYFRKHYGIGSYILLSILSPISLFLAWVSQVFKVKPRTQSRI